jgi:4-hydroxy-3-polyprenylbenzoate decarboxylase
MSPDIETRMEGPLGEWEGYYAGGTRPHPVIRVKAVLHRNDPIIAGEPPLLGPYHYQQGRHISNSANLWNELDKQIPGVAGVWAPPEAGGILVTVVSLRQQYPGHAKQAGLAVVGAYAGLMVRAVIIVDDDIDPSNTSEVLWALATRWDPETATDIIGGRPSIASDPRLPPDQRERGDLLMSTAVIYACKPYSWISEFPTPNRFSPEALAQAKEKWGKVLFGDNLGR